MEEKRYGFVVIKTHYTNETIFEIQCFCFTIDKARIERDRIQSEIDPNYNEWKVIIETLVDIVE